MPFVNATDTRTIQQRYGKYEHQEETGFGEVFDASVGQVIDEELSISSMLNREGFDRRNQLIDEKIQAGEIEAEKYRISSGGRPGQAKASRLDYARIAQDYESEDIRTDEALTQERNELLRSRREYAQDVQERGSGVAQFTGALTGYMLDPINIATVGIAAPMTVGKGITTLGRAMLTARNAALIEGATELGIQTFVYAHKQAIDSPYTSADALANIGMAATGAAVLGGVAGGLSGWLDRVVKFADELPPTKDVEFAKESLKRLQTTIKAMPDPEIKVEDIRREILAEAREELLPIAGEKLSRGDVKQLMAEKQDLEYKLSKVPDVNKQDIADQLDSIKKTDSKGKARAQKAQATKAAEDEQAQAIDAYQSRLDIINQRLERNEKASAAEADLSRIDNGIIPERYQRNIDAVMSEATIQKEIEFLEVMEARATEYAKPSKTADQYEIPEPRKPISRQTVTQREQDILARQDLADTYHAELEEFNALENKILEIDGEQIDAGELMKSFDDELQGLESVLTCVYKGAA